MPNIEGQEIDFDQMSDEELKTFLADLKEKNSSKRPKGLTATGAKRTSTPKPKKDFVKIEL